MNIGVVGIGLIGGSIAKDARQLGHRTVGTDKSAAHGEEAVRLGVVGEVMNLDALVNQSDLIIISVPVNHISDLVIKVLDRIRPGQVVIDVGSTKRSICQSVSDHRYRSQFVACHPLAGTENSGPQAAISGLFRNKKNIICESELSDEHSLKTTLGFVNALGMQSIFMSPDDHDRHVAYVSHLSHVSSFTLGQTVLDIEKNEKHIFNLASTGFSSTVRLAKSDAKTWAAIFCDNSEPLSDALTQYIAQLQEIKTAIDNKDSDRCIEIIENANEIRRVLNGIELNVLKIS